MELFSIRIQRTFQLVSTVLFFASAQTLYFLQIYCLQLVVTLNMDTWLIIYQNMKKRRSSKIGQ